MKLGVNIDHVATLRQARRIVNYPSPLIAALIAQSSGADSIVAHLREDRRHIKDKDVFQIRKMVDIGFNLEMAVNPEIVDIACELKPDKSTIVPERRQEITTEGGVNLITGEKQFKKAFKKLKAERIEVSVFIDPDLNQIKKAHALGVTSLEIHTGRYADAKAKKEQTSEFKRVYRSAEYAKKLGFFVAAGHGLNYRNVSRIAEIEEVEELNIGHSIISRSVFLGLPLAVKDMVRLISPKR